LRHYAKYIGEPESYPHEATGLTDAVASAANKREAALNLIA
jgi:hypothetical protein